MDQISLKLRTPEFDYTDKDVIVAGSGVRPGWCGLGAPNITRIVVKRHWMP